MKKVTFATIAASTLAGITIGLAAPAVAHPSNAGGAQVSISSVGGDQTPYGTYQNEHKRGSHRG